MSFGSIAEDYDGLRPQAPPQAVDWLMPSECEVAVDVGAGTGVHGRAAGTRQVWVTDAPGQVTPTPQGRGGHGVCAFKITSTVQLASPRAQLSGGSCEHWKAALGPSPA